MIPLHLNYMVTMHHFLLIDIMVLISFSEDSFSPEEEKEGGGGFYMWLFHAKFK